MLLVRRCNCFDTTPCHQCRGVRVDSQGKGAIGTISILVGDWLTNLRLLKKEAARRCVSRLSSPIVEYLADAHGRVLHKQAKCLRDLLPRAPFQEQESTCSHNYLGTR